MGNIVFVVWNILVFFIYGYDKFRAMTGSYRVRESMLIVLAFCMAAPGSLLGMIAFRHKIRKLRFCVMILLALLVNILIIMAMTELYNEQGYLAQ